MQKYCFLFFFFLFALVQSQDFDKRIDSLNNILKSSKNKEEKINTLIELGKVYNRSNVDSAFTYFKNAISISEKNNLTPYKVKSYSSIAVSYIIKGKFDSAHYYFNKSEVLINSISNHKIKSSFYGDRGILNYYEGNIAKAAESFERALAISKLNNDSNDIIRYSNNVALAFTQLGKNEEAIDIYYEVLRLAEKDNDKDHVGKILNNIGLIYENMNQYENALNFYERAYDVKKVSATQIDKANAYYNIANMQLRLGERDNDSLLIESAKNNFTETLKISNENEYGNGKLYGYEGLGQIALNKGNYNKAKQIYSNMESVSTKLKNEPFLGVSNLKLGIIAIKENKLGEAKRKLDKAKNIIEKTNVLKDKAQLYGYLNNLYIKLSNYKKAHYYLELNKEIEDKLSSKSLQDKVSNYKVKYETEKKEKEILSQRADIAEKELNLNRKNTQLIGLGVLALVISLLGYLLYNQQKLKNRQLQKESELKEALVKIETQNTLQEQRLRISRDLHDNIGAQLTFIISSIENLQYGFKIKNEKLTDKLNSISNFTKDTIYELRDTIWAMNKNAISLEDLQARISNFIDKADNAFNTTSFSIDIDDGLSKDHTFTSVVGMNIYRIIQEAVNNAIKYAEAKNINIKMYLNIDDLIIQIKDNGKGFNKEEVVLGNGLNNIKKRAQNINAKLEMESKINKGSIITLKMDIG